MARAFGMVGGFKVRDDHDNDVTDEVRQRHPDGPEAFDRVLAAAELELIRSALAGPSPEEEPELRTLGWRPGDHEGIGEQRAAQEREQAERFNADPHWRRGRIRDVVAARELGIEINRILYDGIADRGADLEDVFPDPDATRRAVDSMPSFDVSVSLKTSYHQDPSHRWTANDVHDIDALGSTVPYCDIVVTDKAVASHLRRIGVADRLGTTVLSNLEDLLDHI